MKTIIYLIVTLSLFFDYSIAQDKYIDKYFKINPNDIKSPDSEIQEYDVILKWQNLDAMSGSKINCNAVKATYFVGFENDYVGWKDVSLAQIDDFNQKQFKGSNLPSFNKFSYQAMDTAFLTEEFYKNIPVEQRDLAKWLVSDAMQMQGLALYVFDSLSYNKEFIPRLLENYDVKFENWVTFTSRYQKLIWTGISKYNNEICAIIKFESYFNPIKIENEQMYVKGRALYFGEMWISLQDKQVEYATMMEDDIIKVRGSMFPDEELIDLQREIVFMKKINKL